MSGESKSLITEIMTHPKVTIFISSVISFVTNGAAWYVEWASPIVATLISILSVVLIYTGIKLNITNNKKVNLDIQAMLKENERLKGEVKAISDRHHERIVNNNE